MKHPYWLVTVLVAAIAIAVARGAPAVHIIDVAHSKVTVYVNKQGLFSFFADNHEIEAPIAEGSYDAANNAVNVTINAAKMKALDPKLPADRRNTVQETMIGPKVLDVEKYPVIAFHSTKIAVRDASHWIVTGDLTLHGQTHPVEVDVHKTDDSHFDGSATVRQSTFGITPIRIAGGTVTVKDDVRVEFSVVLGS